MNIRSLAVMSALPLLAGWLTGCGSGYPDMAGEWAGICTAGGEELPFEMYALDTYQGAGSVGGATGDHDAYPMSGRMAIDGDWVSGSGTRIFCFDEAGCSLGANELEDVPTDFYRLELQVTFDGYAYRLVADGVLEEKKSLDGNCWSPLNGQWGTFVAERVQGPWFDAHETEQTHPGMD